MKKSIQILTLMALASVMVMSASAVTQRWDGGGGDAFWTNAVNWNTDTVPAIGDNTAIWSGDAVILDAPGFVDRFWSRHASGNNSLTIVTNGSLTTAGDIALNEFSGSAVSADLLVNGGAAVVSNNLSVAGQSTSVGSGRVFLNSGTIDVLNNVKIGTAGKNTGVDGEVTVNGGVLTVQNKTILGGGNLDTDTGLLIINGGLYTEGTGGTTFQIGTGAGSGTVEMNGGVLVNNNALEMDVDASNDVGTASINFNGGEFWQIDPSITLQDESTLNFQNGVLYWSSNQVAALTDLVANSNVTYVLGLTNMLTESWDAAWTNGFTLDYGYWSKSYGSALYADVDDVTNGYTTVWAYNLSPSLAIPVSNGTNETHLFNNGSGDQLWTTASNWDIGTVPTAEDIANHTANGDTLVVDSAVEVGELNAHNNSTATVAVVQFGTLNVSTNVVLGNGGSAGVGVLQVDGGEVDIAGNFTMGLFGTDARVGIGVLNSGNITVAGETALGGFNSSRGELTINGGTYTQSGSSSFTVGRTGSGMVTLNGGTLNIASTGWNPLRFEGTGSVIINGGELRVKGAQGKGRIELNGGSLNVSGGFSAAFGLQDGAVMHVDQGVFKWAGSAQAAYFATNYVESGFVTWTNGLDTMLSETPLYSYTNGLSSLHVAVIEGTTTVWAFTPPPPTELPEMSIATGAGSVAVSVINLDVAKSYELQSSTMLTIPGWSPVGTTSGVSSATWNVPASVPAEFFQVEEQTP